MRSKARSIIYDRLVCVCVAIELASLTTSTMLLIMTVKNGGSDMTAGELHIVGYCYHLVTNKTFLFVILFYIIL